MKKIIFSLLGFLAACGIANAGSSGAQPSSVIAQQYSPFNGPESSFAYEPWDTGADSLTWRDINFGSTVKTYSDSADSLILSNGSVGGGTQMRIRYTNLPASGTDWTITLIQAAVLLNVADTSGLIILCGGTEVSPTCVEVFGIDTLGATASRIIHFNDTNYDSSSGASARNLYNIGNTTDGTDTHCLQFRYAGSTTNLLESYFSFDCVAFKLVASTTLASDPASAGILIIDETVSHFIDYIVRTDVDRNLPGS